jgi:uncharacterized protein YjbI with pentapeptide repeats
VSPRRRPQPSDVRPRGVTDAPRLPDERAPTDLDDLQDDETVVAARFGGGDAVGATIDGLVLRGTTLAGCRFTGATLSALELVDVVLADCDLSGATVAGAVLHRVTFERCRMSGLVANDIVATDVTWSDCRAEESWLRSARLEHCDLLDCQLTGSDWYGASVDRSRILRCSLDGSELSTAVLHDVALHGSSLAGVRGSDLRDVVIGSDQVVEVAVAVFAHRGIVIDDAAADDGHTPDPDHP